MAKNLFDPITIGAIKAPNRIFMAPLTRLRADKTHTPVPMMAQYYRQRASAGLIISEATGISQEGLGAQNAPGIWLDRHVEAWKNITDEVHKAHGRFICQLWHMGRLVPQAMNDGKPPVSSSPTKAPGHTRLNGERQPYDQARALAIDEIPRIIDDYEHAARNAQKAGFDGIQLHAANGYLVDQFIRDNCNFRDDDYGGSVENRLRLLGEITQRLIAVWGADKVSVRLSPNGEVQGANDSAPQEIFTRAAALLNQASIASLELREPDFNSSFAKAEHPPIAPAMRKAFDGILILNSDYDFARATKTLIDNDADAISFGRPYIANPDLVERFEKGASLNQDDIKTWYIPGPQGYIDYPTMKAETIA